MDMPHRLPPIAALRALESAARHLSFIKAADELNVTPSAISHQVRHLEDLWGLKLFHRRPRRVALTRNGEAMAPIVRDFFNRMTATLDTIRAETTRDPLRVSLLQSFAVKWLVPRLGGFHEKFPDIDVWIFTSDRLVDFASEDIDVVIRLGHGDYPGLRSTLLLREFVFPVCSPRFLELSGIPSAPKDLLDYPLLLRVGEPAHPTWKDWLAKAGVQRVAVTKGSRFPDTNMTLQAAMDGQGIALARSAHVSEDLAAGRLVKLFSDVRCPSTVAYYLVCPEGNENIPKIAKFRKWLLREAALAQAEQDRLAA